MLKATRERWLVLFAVLMAAAVLVAACGGGGGGGAGTDESYVKAMCEAFRKFEEDGDKALAELDEKFAEIEDDEDFEKVMEEAFKAFAKPVSNLASDASKIKPPADVKEYHDQMVVSLRSMADGLKEGNVDLEEDPLESLPEPPQAIQDRLRAAAENESACEGLDVFTS